MDYNNRKIKAILFDSGRVLNGPTTGHWFITPNFFKYVNQQKFNAIKASEKISAFDRAAEYISQQKLIINENEEYMHFFEYYSIFSECLPQLQLKCADIALITKDYVYNPMKYSFYNDAVTVISELSKTYKLAIVSDAWPSLEMVYSKAGLSEYFSAFVISSKLGVTKPNELMYKTALDELGVSPEETVFIDDNIKNCIGASKLGIKPIVLNRDWRMYAYNKLINRKYDIISNLYDVKKMLD